MLAISADVMISAAADAAVDADDTNRLLGTSASLRPSNDT